MSSVGEYVCMDGITFSSLAGLPASPAFVSGGVECRKWVFVSVRVELTLTRPLPLLLPISRNSICSNNEMAIACHKNVY